MRIVNTIGKGLLAGLVGTAAMTAAKTIEMKLFRRPARMAPTQAAEKLLSMEMSKNGKGASHVTNPVYWGYGTIWGIARPLLRTIGLSPGASTAAHLATVWSSEQVLLPALSVAPPSVVLGRKEIAFDAWNHLVYATAAGLAYELLGGRR
jgi:hypothetical protein